MYVVWQILHPPPPPPVTYKPTWLSAHRFGYKTLNSGSAPLRIISVPPNALKQWFFITVFFASHPLSPSPPPPPPQKKIVLKLY